VLVWKVSVLLHCAPGAMVVVVVVPVVEVEVEVAVVVVDVVVVDVVEAPIATWPANLSEISRLCSSP
jgi:hypothetical protein